MHKAHDTGHNSAPMAPHSDPYAEALQFARGSKFQDAAAAIDRFLAQSPSSADGLTLAASIRLALGQAAEALVASDAAIAIMPGLPRAHAARADALQALKRFEDAVASYDRAIALKPDQVSALTNRGNTLAELDRSEEALASYSLALAMAPDAPQIHSNRARVLNELQRFDEAIESADRAISLNPNYANAWMHRGKAFYGLLRFPEALECFFAAARIDGRSGEVLTNLGMGLAAVGRYAESLTALDLAVALSSAPSPARFQRARVRLMLGEFGSGWDDYEARWDDRVFVATGSGCVTEEGRRHMSPPAAADDIAGARLLLLSEQGVGEEIMFASMLPDVLGLAASATLVCDPRLTSLFAESFPALTVMGRDAARTLRLGDFDRITPMGSLCRAMRRNAAAFPGAPYLAPRRDLVARWGERLGPANGRMRVGISWRGGTQKTGGAARSMSLAQLKPLLDVDGCDFVSLQYGDPRDEIAAANRELGQAIKVFPAVEIDDFEELAALTMALDHVVTIQTALVHLCGAVGQKAIVMVPKRPEWRYMASGPSMPWYGSVQIIRQTQQEDWNGVIAQTAEALAERRRAAISQTIDRS